MPDPYIDIGFLDFMFMALLPVALLLGLIEMWWGKKK